MMWPRASFQKMKTLLILRALWVATELGGK
jgi:hypothetical protein